jgi:hypothetical protein
VIQLALLCAVHLQVLAAVTDAVALPPAAGSLCVAGVTAAVHCVVKVNVFESALVPVPFGPTAATSDTYTVPGTGHPANTVERSTVMVLVLSGAGFPRLTV